MNTAQQKIAEETVAYMREQGLTIDQGTALSSGMRYSSEIDLGFSLDSLKHIDRLLGTLCRKKKMGPSPKDLFYIGFYVGEVLLRHTFGQWITDESGAMKDAMIVEIPDFLTVNVIEECWNRLRYGANASVEWNCKGIVNVKGRLRKEMAKTAATDEESA